MTASQYKQKASRSLNDEAKKKPLRTIAERRKLKRPHVYKDDTVMWCGIVDRWEIEVQFRDGVPKHKGSCAHCRAAYRRTLKDR